MNENCLAPILISRSRCQSRLERRFHNLVNGSVLDIDLCVFEGQSWAHCAQTQGGISGGDVSRDESWRPSGADFPG